MIEQAQAEARRLRLTDRWTPLRHHAGQALYFWSPARFKVCPSGRRSGKTELAKRKGVLKLVRDNAHPFRGLYGAPTLDQARNIFWEDLKALTPGHWVRRINETRLEIVTHWGAMLRVFGFDRPQRAEGVVWDWICIDEMADAKPRCFAMHLRPMLSTIGREGSADMIGVPDESGPNQIEYEELWERGLRWHPDPTHARIAGGDSEVCSFWWPSSDIITASEDESAKRGMGELEYRQEYGGAFVRSGGKALPTFDVKLHVSERFAEYAPTLPVDWSLDFGTRWVAHLIAQSYRGNVWILDEIALQDSSTDVAADEFFDLCDSRGYDLSRLRVFGDAAGATRGSNIGVSDYDIIEEKVRRRGLRGVEWQQLRGNPLVKDTLNAVRGRVGTADGVIHLHIHPRCQRLIQDCKRAPWPDGSNRLRDYHWLAALRYYCYSLFGDTSARMDTAPMAYPALGGR